jgi:imidazolonepropionase-like amidohydrolase
MLPLVIASILVAAPPRLDLPGPAVAAGLPPSHEASADRHSLGAGGQTGGPITIHAARLFNGRGGWRDDVTLTIEGTKIVAIGTRPAPYTYDLGDVTLMPGMIDVHTHVDWHFQPNGLYGARPGQPRETPEQRDAAIAANLLATLNAGFTTVQNVGSAGDAVFRERVAAGELPGPRILTSLGQVSRGTPDELREAVRKLKAGGADVVKIFASESIRTGGAPTMTQEQLDAACGEASAQGLRTLVHAHAVEAIIRVVNAKCTQVEHGAYASDEALKLMRDRGVYFDPNIGLVLQNYIENKEKFLGSGNYNEEGFAFMEKAVGIKGEMFKRALKSGVRMPMGTDAVAGAHGQNAREILARVEEGQPIVDALVGATALAAESLGLAKTIGTLAEGFEADVIAVPGDPRRNISSLRQVMFVMKGGRVHKNTVK